MTHYNPTSLNIKIVIPGYNCSQWIHKGIKSIKEQTFTNFKCIIIDDASTDNTFEVAKEAIDEDDRFQLIRNTENVGALANIYNGIKLISNSDEDIIVTLDGDDWFYDATVLETVNSTYITNNCLITYGCFIEYPSGITHPYYLTPYEDNILENNLVRDVPWKASALRTFKKKLWDCIQLEDLINPKTGKFYTVTWDLAFMFPMMEMAGDRSNHIPQLLYVYNKENPISDMYIRKDAQLGTEDDIRRKPKYARRHFE